MSAYQKRPSRTYVEKLAEQTGLKKSVIARRLGIIPSQLSRYLSGERAMPDDVAVKFVELCNEQKIPMTLEKLRAMAGYPRPVGRPRKPAPVLAVGAPPDTFQPLPGIEMPVYSYAAAGPMTDEALIEEDEPMLVVESDAKRILVRIRGRSLEPHIKDGEVVKVDRHRAAQNGELVIFQLDEYTGCGFLQMKGRRPVKIRKSAPGYKDIAIRAGQTFSVQGVVTKIVSESEPPREQP